MYGVEWLIVMVLLGLAAGFGGGYLLARRLGAGSQRLRELEEQLATARQQYEDYRHEVVTQFSETARKFQTLNDSYTDLHRQLAKSSSILCGDVSGPLLAAPAGHQDLLTDGSRDTTAPAEAADEPPEPATTAAHAEAPAVGTPAADAPAADAPAADAPTAAAPGAADANGAPADEEPPTLRERVERAARAADAPAPAPAEATLADIRVAEPAEGRGALLRDPGSRPDERAGSPERAANGEPEARSATGQS